MFSIHWCRAEYAACQSAKVIWRRTSLYANVTSLLRRGMNTSLTRYAWLTLKAYDERVAGVVNVAITPDTSAISQVCHWPRRYRRGIVCDSRRASACALRLRWLRRRYDAAHAAATWIWLRHHWISQDAAVREERRAAQLAMLPGLRHLLRWSLRRWRNSSHTPMLLIRVDDVMMLRLGYPAMNRICQFVESFTLTWGALRRDIWCWRYGTRRWRASATLRLERAKMARWEEYAEDMDTDYLKEYTLHTIAAEKQSSMTLYATFTRRAF